MVIVGLHGFWGSPADFDALKGHLGQQQQTWFPDLFATGPLDPSHALADWTTHFLAELRKRVGETPVRLIGYSQGARLALHAVLREPARFEHTWLLSAHPGQLDEAASRARADWIRVWQEKIMHQDWESLVKDWNQMDVFSGSQENSCPQVSRIALAQALENWSLLRHEFDWEQLRSLRSPVTWVFGALDQKFLAVKESLQRQDVRGEFWVVEKAGHRLLKAAPELLAQRLIHQKGVSHVARIRRTNLNR